MPAWIASGTIRPLIAFHGTTDRVLFGWPGRVGDLLYTFVVDIMLCRANTDFGQRFYLTTSEHQAREWAKTRAAMRPGERPVLLRYELDRNWLAGLDVLAFVVPDSDFWAFVGDFRSGIPPHQRSSSNRYRTTFDLVYGPVTLWPQILHIANSDQISFDTSDGVDPKYIGYPFVHDIGHALPIHP